MGALGMARVSRGELPLLVSQICPLFPNLCTSSALSNLCKTFEGGIDAPRLSFLASEWFIGIQIDRVMSARDAGA